jgi:hypothetical protein
MDFEPSGKFLSLFEPRHGLIPSTQHCAWHARIKKDTALQLSVILCPGLLHGAIVDRHGIVNLAPSSLIVSHAH